MNRQQRLPLLFYFFISFILVACQTPSQNFSNQPLQPVVASNNSNYVRLQNALLTYQNAARHPWPSLPNHLIKPGMNNPTVGLLREKLILLGDLPARNYPNNNNFDPTLVDAVKHFQMRHGLKADGMLGNDTRLALNITPQERIREIQINMARWIQIAPQSMGRYILVNIPEYKLYVYDQSKEYLSMKIIVGKPERPTPELKSNILRLVFNPYWNVPRKIAQKDIAPKMVDDPYYLSDQNIHVYERQEKNATPIDDENIDWEHAKQNGLKYHLRQDPGLNNALGLVKFEFPNNSDVYLHDTPAKNLFAENTRAFSSGCIRLEKPFELVQYLTQGDTYWDNERVQTVLTDGKTVYAKVKQPIPIIITYMTTWVDEDGTVHFTRDIYHKNSV